MENNKLGKKIRDWATNFGFTLPDGSAPSADNFVLLTATPHRRQLWELIIELVQPRQKIECMRKQILVAKLRDMKMCSKTEASMHATDRLDLWKKQNVFEADVKDKRDCVVKLEKRIMAKISDSVFEICKLSELEKRFEEFSEKSLILKLLVKRKQKMVEEMEKRLLKVSYLCNYLKKSGGKENLNYVDKELLNVEDCNSVLENCYDCALIKKVEELCKSGSTPQCLWEDVIKCKEISVNEFSRFLEDLNSNEKNFFCEREEEAEKNLMLSITQLKQKTTEKSLQVIINTTEGKVLDLAIQKLEEKLVQKGLHMGSLTGTFSLLIPDEKSEFDEESEKAVKNLKNHLTLIGLQNYQQFLKEELEQMEKEMIKTNMSDDDWKNSKNAESGLQFTLKNYEHIVEEINFIKSEEEKVVKEIFVQYGQFQNLVRSLKEEIEMKSNALAEGFVSKLKFACEKQKVLLLDTPLSIFRTVESSLGRLLFECESAFHCLNEYGGEFKQFFTSMIIPPLNDLQKILSEIEKRKRILSETKKFISERDELTELQKKIQHQLNSIKYDSQLCEKNFKKSDGILWSSLSKTDELFQEVDFIEKILKNWVEQPYRFMINGKTEGKC